MAAKDDLLAAYERKHDVDRTSEPRGSRRRRGADPLFVIQQHAASSMHWDFRLEADGVLKSWAVPKGPSTDPREKRLAVPTEDHPMDYADFEGVIAAGEYGGGSVIVWDTGTYRNLTTDDGGAPVPVAAAVEDGHVSFWLEGTKLRGGWTLTRTGRGWLLVKRRDAGADARRRPVRSQPESVLTGRTVEQVAREEC
jgi:DNA ligase D-like protein (predicted 3'-phosphoesterase)